MVGCFHLESPRCCQNFSTFASQPRARHPCVSSTTRPKPGRLTFRSGPLLGAQALNARALGTMVTVLLDPATPLPHFVGMYCGKRLPPLYYRARVGA